MIKSELRSFHAVAVHGGFTAASRQLNISQPTLSTQVKNLEERYGIELFNRVGKKIHLTLAGKELFQITSDLAAQRRMRKTYWNPFGAFMPAR
jgi:DNA-binding transcriptional LysR family regulator